MSASRIVAAFYLAPLAILPPFLVPSIFSNDGGMWFSIGLVAVAMAYAGMLLIGLPVILVLRRYRFTQWWQATLAGALGPAALTWSDSTNALLTFGLSGAFVALVAWFIAFYQKG